MDQITISLNAYQQVHKNLFKIHNHKNAIQKHYQLSKLINKCDSIDTCVRNEHIWDFDDYINHFGFKEFSIIVDNNGSKKKPYLYKKNEYYTYNISKSNRNTKFKSIRKLNNRLIKKHNIRELLYYSETISNLIVQKKWNILAKHFYQIYLKHDLTKTIELLKEISKINNLNIDTKNIKIVKEDRKALEKSFLSIEDN